MPRPSPQTDRVVALLELLAARPDATLTLAETTRRLQVNKSTCHSMLTSLVRAGWLLRDPTRKTYRLGPALAAIGRAATASFPALDFAHGAVIDLSSELAANCAALGVADDHLTVLDDVRHLRSPSSGLRVGSSMPLRAPFGMVVTAWRDPAAIEAWLADVPAANRPRFRDALALTRRRGFAVEMFSIPESRLHDLVTASGTTDASRVDRRDLLPGYLEAIARELSERDDFLPLELEPAREYRVTSVNAPVLDHAGDVALVLTVYGFGGPVAGGDVARIGQQVRAAATEITTALGGTGLT
jgi:DNA-binding IclR family transcriptional regulator